MAVNLKKDGRERNWTLERDFCHYSYLCVTVTLPVTVTLWMVHIELDSTHTSQNFVSNYSYAPHENIQCNWDPDYWLPVVQMMLLWGGEIPIWIFNTLWVICNTKIWPWNNQYWMFSLMAYVKIFCLIIINFLSPQILSEKMLWLAAENIWFGCYSDTWITVQLFSMKC